MSRAETRPLTVFWHLAPLFAASALMYTGHSATFATVPAALGRLDAPQFWIGQAGTLYFMGFVIGTVLAPRVIAEVGQIRVFAAAAASYTAALLAAVLVEEVAVWILARFIAGMALAGMSTVTETWMTQATPARFRSTVVSGYMILINGAFILGATGARLSPEASTATGFMVTGALVAFSLVPLALARTEAPPAVQGRESRLGIRRLYAISPVGLLGCMMAGALQGSYSSLGPLIAAPEMDDPEAVANLLLANYIGATLAQYPVGRLSDRFDRRSVLLVLMLAATVVSIAFGLAAEGPRALFLLIGAVLGGLFACCYPVAMAHASDFIQDHERVSAGAALLLAYGVGAFAAPAAVGALMSLQGSAAFSVSLAGLSLLLCLFILFRMLMRAPPQSRAPYVAIPPTSAALPAFATGDDGQYPLPLTMRDGRPA